MQTGIVKANDGRLYYIGEDGTVQKKAQWIEQDWETDISAMQKGIL